MGAQKHEQWDEPFGGFWIFVLWPEDFKSAPSLTPCLIRVSFHSSYNAFLLGVVEGSEVLDKVVDIKHGQVGYQSHNNNDVDKDMQGECVVDAPKRLEGFSFGPDLGRSIYLR